MFVQQSLQPKLSRRCYASVSYALQNNTFIDGSGYRLLRTPLNPPDLSKNEIYSQRMQIINVDMYYLVHFGVASSMHLVKRLGQAKLVSEVGFKLSPREPHCDLNVAPRTSMLYRPP